MARRVALARAIALDPMMVMADEPFTGLDPSQGRRARLIAGSTTRSASVHRGLPRRPRPAISPLRVSWPTGGWSAVRQGGVGLTAGRVQQFMQGLPDGPVPFHYPANAYLDDLLQGDRR